MSPNFEKLQHLWRNLSSTLGKEPRLVARVDRIYEIANRWEQAETAIEAIGPKPTPEDNQIPAAPWPKAREGLFRMYDGDEELKAFRSQVDDVEALLHIQSRKEEFRIASNAKADSSHETHNTTPTQSNPESYYASYNYPFEIVRFFLSCKFDLDQIHQIKSCDDCKFVRKYLWMLARRDDVVPILSVVSFYALAPLLQQLVSGIDWGDKGSQWSLAFSDFVSRWPDVSVQLSQRITGKAYRDLDAVKKRDFAKLLFVASLTETTTKNALDMLRTGNQAIILYGPPGTGKTHQAQEVVKQLLETPDQNSTILTEQFIALDACNFTKLFPDPEPKSDGLPPNGQPPAISSAGCWALIQFHPTYSYHDFIGGIMPKLTGEVLSYVRKEGIFKRFCDAAKANQPKPFVLIIDEINRADLSSVFGELMYALEYRNKKVTILHFGPFEIPDNVYVIGTMNSADKSLVTFDLALRRRFLFFKLMPDMSVLIDWNAKQEPPIHDEDLGLLIDSATNLNKAIVGELNLPEDYGIGQAYFMKILDFCVEDAVGDGNGPRHRITECAREQLWVYHLEPLLEEYLGAEDKTKKNDLEKLRDAFVKSA